MTSRVLSSSIKFWLLSEIPLKNPLEYSYSGEWIQAKKLLFLKLTLVHLSKEMTTFLVEG